jgi:hypothetical protein
MAISHTTLGDSRSAAARFVLSTLLSAGVFLAGVLATATAEAQKSSKGKQPGAGHGSAGPPGGAAGIGAPPVRGGPGTFGQMPGMPGGGIGTGRIQKKAAPERSGKPTEPVDPEKLPPKYHVPQEPPEALTTTDEWLEDPFTRRKPKTQGTVIGEYRTILGSGQFTGEEQRKFVADMVRWRLSLLTRKEFREQAQAKRNDLWVDITKHPYKGNSRDVRKFLLQTIAEEAPQLFKYHAVARINGAILLADLSDTACNEADGDGRNKPPEPCFRAAKPLLDLVNDKNQLVAARIWGVNGLVRIASLPQVKPAMRTEIVDVLVRLVNESAGEHEWYQWRLVEGLGRLNVVADAQKRLVVPQALARVLADQKRHWLVRSEAAVSIGRLPYTVEINAGVIAYQVGLLAQQMTEAYNDEPELALWKLCFMKLYGAFKPLSAEQVRGLLTQTERGPLAPHKRVVQEAFDLVLPLVRKVIANEKDLDTASANLKKWLDSNTPAIMKIHADEDLIVTDEPIVKKAENVGAPPPADNHPAANGGSR